MDEITKAAIWSLMQAFYALHNQLEIQGAIEPGSVAEHIRQMTSADPEAFPVDHGVAVHFLNNIARAIDTVPGSTDPFLAVIDGGKED